MAVTVRVQNFQSIEDATVVIDGLTVITGTNNSGKTSLMRAIRGVFTNAPAGPLVRHGCSHLSVTLTFDDGATILWEKGWEKPGQKGKTVNRYTINGKQIATVGRGVPPEVEALGVREIQAASDRVWPQIADQFDGTLFLVNRPGSAVAEALSDVERVGKLTSALKASEKDRRSVNAELKVRRKDVDSYKQEVDLFDGLDTVGDLIRGLDQFRQDVETAGASVEEVRSLRTRHGSAVSKVEDLSGFDPTVIPDSVRSEKLSVWSRKIGVVEEYRDRYAAASDGVSSLSGFDPTVIPDSTRVEKLSRVVETVSTFQQRHRKASGAVGGLSGFAEPNLPDTSALDGLALKVSTVRSLCERLASVKSSVEGYADFTLVGVPDADVVEQARSSLDAVIAFRDQIKDACDTLTELGREDDRVAAELALAESEVKRLLGDRGVCPTCNTIHEGAHP
jgi:exonuclease SbcC